MTHRTVSFWLYVTASILLIVGGCSCANKGQMASFSELKSYRKSLQMTVNGRAGKGVMTVPVSPAYTVQVFPPANAEAIIITSCHKQITDIRADKGSIWTSNRPVTYNLAAMEGIETIGNCPITIDTVDMDGNNGFGMIDFENEKLFATVLCNGDALDGHGVSLCQTKVGLTERIMFFEPVAQTVVTPGCPELDALESMVAFDVIMQRGLCTYLFKGKKTGDFHRFTTFGYDDLFIPGIKPKNQ